MGPVTQSGCGAICPAYDRGCYGCFGPKERANTFALKLDWETHKGVSAAQSQQIFRTFHAWSEPFRNPELGRPEHG